MARSLKGIIVLIIILVIIGAGAAYYFYYFLPGQEDKVEEPPPKITNRAPIAAFELLNGSNARVNDIVWFDANASRDPDGQIKRFEWYFGDGAKLFITNITETKVNYTYRSAGDFDVNLTVVDNLNGKSTEIKTMTIRPTDYTDEATAILMSREPSGVSLSEVNVSIPVEDFAVSLEVNISIIGVGFGDSTLEDAILDAQIFDPYGNVIGNETKASRITTETMKFYFEASDLKIVGAYELYAKCTQGTLRLSYKIEVLY
jgi:PKD repeat protein